jgi:hypothetical protein
MISHIASSIPSEPAPLVDVDALLTPQSLAVPGLHERHAELVQVIALLYPIDVEDHRPGDVQIGFD